MIPNPLLAENVGSDINEIKSKVCVPEPHSSVTGILSVSMDTYSLVDIFIIKIFEHCYTGG